MNTPRDPARPPLSLLFVCMGNICRSPLAEAIFVHLATERDDADRFTVDSCGTGGWHAGELPDPRARQTASRHGIRMSHRARQFTTADFHNFDLLLAMDQSNLDLLIHAGAPPARTFLIRAFDPTRGSARDDLAVPDPYYGGDDGFEDVFHMLTRACSGLLDAIDAAAPNLPTPRPSE